MSAIPDRKYMIWVSHGLGRARPGLDGRIIVSAPSDVTEFARTLDNEGITLNSVDLGNPVSITSVAFDDFAKFTGGKVYPNDFEKALSETVAASHSSYIIQYDAPRSDGKLHKIRVTSTRKGLRLQVEQAYVANP